MIITGQAWDAYTMAGETLRDHRDTWTPDVDPFSGAYAETAKQTHITELKALEDVMGAPRGMYVRAWYWDWKE